MEKYHSVAEGNRLDIDSWVSVHMLVDHLDEEAGNWRLSVGTKMWWTTTRVLLRRLEAGLKGGVST
jgi:hypothetical protein